MARKTKKTGELVPSIAAPDTAALLADLRGLIDAGRTRVAQAVNAGMVALYWGVGDRIRREILGERRAAYGEQIVAALSQQLTAEYGRGYSRFALMRMIQFAELFPETQIVQTLSAQLGWSHFIELLPLKDPPLKRDFYAEMCRLEHWSVRTLRAKVAGMLYERTAIAKKPEEIVRRELETLRTEDRLTPDLVFRDPYVLDVRHDNRESIADPVSRTLGRRCLSRPTYLKSKDNREHSLLVKRRLTTKCPDHAPQGLRSMVKATLLELQFHRTSGSPVGRAFDDDADRSGRSNRTRPDSQRSG